MEYLRRNDQRAKTAITLVWIVLAVEVISLISSLFQYNLLQTALIGGEISYEAATANDTREQIVGIVYILAFFASGVTFIMWFRRAYFNLHQLVPHLSYSEGWAAGSWFIPILNLFRPYQIMKELFEETKALLKIRNLDYGESPSSSKLGIWWTLWVVSNLIGQFILRASRKAETIDQLNTLTMVEIVGNIIGIPLALVTVNFIKEYSKVEPVLLEIPEISSRDTAYAHAGNEQ